MSFASIPLTGSKPEQYAQLLAQAEALLHGETDRIANAANLSALVYHALPDLNWAGFYFFDYDWRRSNLESVRRLDRQLEALRVARGGDLGVDLICQSNAGKICRYLVKYGSLAPAEGEAGAVPQVVEIDIGCPLGWNRVLGGLAQGGDGGHGAQACLDTGDLFNPSGNKARHFRGGAMATVVQDQDVGHGSGAAASLKESPERLPAAGPGRPCHPSRRSGVRSVWGGRPWRQ